MKIKIRADASPEIGTGHVMRCLALALWAQKEGLDVAMAGYVPVPWLRDRISKEGFPFCFLNGDDVREVLSAFPPGVSDSWIIVDGYHFDLGCQRRLRQAGFKLMVIDDYAHQKEYSCDILLNQNLGASGLAYAGDIDAKLLGPEYALLRPEFVEKRNMGERERFLGMPRNILVSLGGGDSSAHWKKVVHLLSALDLRGATLRVIAGATPEPVIRREFQHCPADLEILIRVEDMPALLQWADFCLTAAGSTCWELCCLGVPFAAVAIADNQKIVAERLGREGISLSLQRGWPGEDAWRQARQNELALVDGLGAKRVLEILR